MPQIPRSQVFHLFPDELNGVQTFSSIVPSFLEDTVIDQYPEMYSKQIARINYELQVKQRTLSGITILMCVSIVFFLVAIIFFALAPSGQPDSDYIILAYVLVVGGLIWCCVGTLLCANTWRPSWAASLPNTVEQSGGCMNLALLTGGRSALPLTQRIQISEDQFIQVQRERDLSLPVELGPNPVPVMAWRVQYSSECNFKGCHRSLRVKQINIYWDRTAPMAQPIAQAQISVDVQRVAAALNAGAQPQVAVAASNPAEQASVAPFSVAFRDEDTGNPFEE